MPRTTNSKTTALNFLADEHSEEKSSAGTLTTVELQELLEHC